MTATLAPTQRAELGFLWLEITGRCQLECVHCYADSGTSGTHGSMGYDDWISVIDQAAALGTQLVQFIGGEPTLHPGLIPLTAHALARGVEVEIYSNLVRVSDAMWETFAQTGVRLATSYYSDDPSQHLAITRRNTLARTRANIAAAVRCGIPVRVGIIELGDRQRVEQAKTELATLGVTNVDVDRMRLLGRPARTACDASELCGQCGDGIAAVLPDGSVSPCPLGRWLTAGNVLDTPLPSMVEGLQHISETMIKPATVTAWPCEPNCNPGCNPGMQKPDDCNPRGTCDPNKRPDPQCNPTFKCRPK